MTRRRYERDGQGGWCCVFCEHTIYEPREDDGTEHATWCSASVGADERFHSLMGTFRERNGGRDTIDRT